MKFSPFKRILNAEAIAASLKNIPSNWSLTPLRGKRPYRKGWQTEQSIPRDTIAELILNGQEAISKNGNTYRGFASGFGLRLGDASDGLLAVDIDGASAQPILEAMSGGDIPVTVAYTSSKPGRCQLVFQIPENVRASLQEFTRSVVTEWGNLTTSEGELLEFRYNRSQSALPPSHHPDTGAYQWINPPVDTAVATAPDWLCEILLQLVEGERRDEEARLQAKRDRERAIEEAAERRKALGIVGSVDLVDCFAQSVERLSPEEIFNWSGHSFKRKGKEWFGCCPQHHSQSGESFTVRPDSLDWHCFGCDVGGGVGEYRHFVNGGRGTPRGKDFYEITKELAAQAGIELPSSDKSHKLGKQPSKATNQESFLLLQSTTPGILNPPFITSSLIQSLKDRIFKILPIPKSVASCFPTEKKASRKERKWFERILNRLKKVFSKSKQQLPRLGFKCFKEDNPGFEEKIRKVQRKLRALSYDTDIVLNQRYLPSELVNQLPKSGLIGVKAPKGCGKSVLLKKIIALAKKQGVPVLSITPRIALGREQAIKWEVTWIDDYGTMQTRAGDTTNQIKEVANKREQARAQLAELEAISHHQLSLLDNTEEEKLEQQKIDLRAEIERYGEEIENINVSAFRTLGLCWDSLWRTKDRDLKNSLIIIDEAELGFNHFVAGSTCRRNRPYLLKVFTDKIRECLMSGGRVILSDADLSDLPINYVRELLPIPITPFIVRNDYIGDETRWLVDFRSGSRGTTLDEIIANVKLGFHLVITTDSQAEAEALEKKILDELPDFCAFLDSEGEITAQTRGGEKAIIVRLDRNTAQCEEGKKFIQKPNESILQWKPRILIYTPTLGVGVSIDESTQRIDEEWGESVPYFDFVYGLFFGVIEPSQCRQQLARVRANVPRIVWCKEFNRGLEGCASFFPDEIKRQMLKYNHSALSIIDLAKGIAGYEADDEAIREAMLKLLQETWDSKSRCWKDPSLDLYAAFKARENYSLWNLANVLREELEDEGHKVIALDGGKSNLLEEIATIKDELKMEEARLIAEAPIMPLEEAQKLLNKIGITKEERRSVTKTLLQDELPEIELTAEFIYKVVVSDRRRWLNRHKLFWSYLNFDASKSADTDHWLSRMRKFAEGNPFIPDVRSFTPKVQAIRESGVLEVFVELENPEKIYKGDSDEAKRFLKRALLVKDILQTALSITVTQKSEPISLANRILSKVGLALEKVSKSKKDNRYRLAAALVSDLDRLAVLRALDLKWQIACNPVPVSAEVGGELPRYINENLSSPPIVKEGSHDGVDTLVSGVEVVCSDEPKTPVMLSQQAIEVGGEVPVSFNIDLSSPPIVKEGSRVVVSQTVSQELLQPSTPPQPQVELRTGMQIRVNIQKSSNPKVREVRAKEHGIVGTIQVAECDRDLYTILCEDGKLRYFNAEVLEVVDENLSSAPIEEVSQVADGGKRSDRGGLKVGDRVLFTNPDKLEESKLYEGVCMKINRLIEGLLAFCQLPDGSEQTFGISTLELAT